MRASHLLAILLSACGSTTPIDDAGTQIPTENFADAGTWGIPTANRPTWAERSIFVLTNAVRMNPADFRTHPVYAARTPSLSGPNILSATYPSQPPLLVQDELSQSSRFHSDDMATKNYFDHDSEDGTSFGTRVRSFYALSSVVGENIAAGNIDALRTMHQWLCDQPNGSTTCCADGESCDGHRRNIMQPNFRALGVGYAFNSTAQYRAYWTQDFGAVTTSIAGPLVDATHLLTSETELRFVTNVFTTANVQSVQVVIDGTAQTLTLDLGTAKQGTYFLTTPRGSICRTYFFITTDSEGRAWRYPARGRFSTTSEATTCTDEYLP